MTTRTKYGSALWGRPVFVIYRSGTLFENPLCEVIQVMTPYVPRMTSGHLAVLVRNSYLIEALEHLLAVFISDVFLSAHGENEEFAFLCEG